VTRLGVNIDHIATIREARKTDEPDPLQAAVIAELAGADGITVHLRGDRRHIKERDVKLLRQMIKTKLNLEMAATEEMVQIALREKVDTSTLVPEKPDELTTEGGLDVVKNRDVVKKAVSKLKEGGITVSIFLDPIEEQIRASTEVGADEIEINTGRYAEAESEKEAKGELKKIITAARLGHELGLRVLAGHGLTYRNVREIVAIPEIKELNIGHNIVAHAALIGLFEAVRRMKALLE
jgi:pyridoxine 5-phosphate synthase